MKNINLSISFFLILLLSITSCHEVSTSTTNSKTEQKKCCKENEVCKNELDTFKKEVIELGHEKSCCVKEEVIKCCSTTKNSSEDSVRYTVTNKSTCENEVSRDSKKKVCNDKIKTNQSDSTTINNCLSECVKPCCSGEIKKACEPKCELYCCIK
jgi:hypothetical protein